MIPWQILGVARAPDGGELILYRRGEAEYMIRVDGRELMSSRAHHSEEAMAELVCRPLAGAAAPRVLIGGLGMGFTLGAALAALPARAAVVVAELVPAVVDWNRGLLAPLAGRPLEDPRVTVEVADVGALLDRAGARYDAVLYDVDNGPDALTRPANQALYGPVGLARVKGALAPGGTFAVWSAGPDARFARRLARAGFRVATRALPVRVGRGGIKHTVFVARVR